jgi:hypothetical protein
VWTAIDSGTPSVRSRLAIVREMTGREVARLSAAGIACWGIALSYLDNPHNPPPPSNLPLGRAAIQNAKAVGAKTRR